jgi:hypothetical protein
MGKPEEIEGRGHRRGFTLMRCTVALENDQIECANCTQNIAFRY